MEDRAMPFDEALWIKAQMIRHGEKIEPFSECCLMEEAAKIIHESGNLYDKGRSFERQAIVWWLRQQAPGLMIGAEAAGSLVRNLADAIERGDFLGLPKP